MNLRRLRCRSLAQAVREWSSGGVQGNLSNLFVEGDRCDTLQLDASNRSLKRLVPLRCLHLSPAPKDQGHPGISAKRKKADAMSFREAFRAVSGLSVKEAGSPGRRGEAQRGPGKPRESHGGSVGARESQASLGRAAEAQEAQRGPVKPRTPQLWNSPRLHTRPLPPFGSLGALWFP